MSQTDGESPAEQSNLKITLKISGPNFEIITNGEIQEIVSNLEALSDLTSQIREQIIFESEEPEETTLVPTPPDLDIPAITPSGGIQDNIQKLFETSWGKTPRELSQVTQALEQNTVYSSSQTVNTALFRLIKAGKIRRRQNNGRWEYFSIPGRA